MFVEVTLSCDCNLSVNILDVDRASVDSKIHHFVHHFPFTNFRHKLSCIYEEQKFILTTCEA
jgi:hypothetical protein